MGTWTASLVGLVSRRQVGDPILAKDNPPGKGMIFLFV
jgi:hypothetical protein